MVKRIKNVKTNNNFDNEDFIKKFVILLSVVVVVIVAFYFLTEKLVTNKEIETNNNTVNVEVDYNKVNVGTLLNRPYNEYLVMVYDGGSKDAVYYSTLITNYQSKENAKKIYFCDLSNSLNSSFKAEDGKTNTKDSDLSNLKFGEITLINVKNGKITESYENIDQIKKALQ